VPEQAGPRLSCILQHPRALGNRPRCVSHIDSIMNDKTRSTLLGRLRDGADVLAWDEFFARYWPMIHALARYHGCSEHTAEEVVQDVVLKIFEKRDVFRYDPQRGRFRDWLATVIRNQVAEQRRRPSERIRARGDVSSDVPPEPRAVASEPDGQWETVFEQSLLAAMLDVVRRQVEPETYMAFELLALREMRCPAVCRATGLSRSAVYRAKKCVLDRLRQLAGTYQRDGQLQNSLKEALDRRPDPATERSLTACVEKTMRSA
jgi:RNA polymerase sigma factor (sigma-70 family)